MHNRFATASFTTALVGNALLAAMTLSAAFAQDMPRRKSGLWEISMEAAGTKGALIPAMTQCVDQAKDDLMRQGSQQMADDNKCKTTNISQSAGRMSFESTCEFGGTKIASKTAISGDFNTTYRMEIQSKYSPPMAGMADGTTIMTAKHIGACKAGQRPGDTTMPGGMTVNVYDMMDGKKK